MLIAVSNLNCTRAGKLILSNISVSVDAGECLILRGPNGSGKTTLLRHLAGLGKDSPQSDIAFSGHLDAIKSTLTVLENLEFWAGIYGTSKTAQVIEQLQLSDLVHRSAGDMSAGQKRRLGLARLLLTDAKLWLMDEPTVSLDTETTSLIVDAIKVHCNAGGGAIISTHIDLGLPNARLIDVTKFAPQDDTQNDPFLEGTF